SGSLAKRLKSSVPLIQRLEPHHAVGERLVRRRQAPWHFLNFLPEPHQQGSIRPTLSFSATTRCVVTTLVAGSVSKPAVATPPPPSPSASPPPAAAIASAPASDSCS